ncbi:unnamed protein product [Effrenium voratum]|uniref:CSD domain-containing protein n=1 Tax=Effrenium voratum TaxID=2562239 RepID=A0AA36N8A2_9DINO|nr:unnamed protein product [Effrenium voratum]CAJ1423394.1 unnamed protein product [Effrenium voratum]
MSYTGKLKMAKQGCIGCYGFIETKGPKDVFVHESNFAGLKAHVGKRLKFDTELGFDGRDRACNVKVAIDQEEAGSETSPRSSNTPRVDAFLRCSNSGRPRRGVLIKGWPESEAATAGQQFAQVRSLMQRVAEHGGGKLGWRDAETRKELVFVANAVDPQALENTTQNLRALIHSRYSVGREKAAKAEIRLSSLKGLPHDVKEEIAFMQQKQAKAKGKADRELQKQRKNHCFRKCPREPTSPVARGASQHLGHRKGSLHEMAQPKSSHAANSKWPKAWSQKYRY